MVALAVAMAGAPAPKAFPDLPTPEIAAYSYAPNDAHAAPESAPSGPAKTVVESDEHGGIIVSARGKPPPDDPLQELNIKAFAVVQAVDKAVVAPAAYGYERRVPEPVRDGVTNVLTLLEEPTIFGNFLLQHKIGKAAETLARTVINLTLGVGGLFDIAKGKGFRLAHRVNGFGYTMGFYGIKTGPYLYLPFFGGITVRDLAGRLLDLNVLPVAVGKPFTGIYYSLIHGTLSSIQDRIDIDETLRIQLDSPDPYGEMKRYYLNKRQTEINALKGIFPPKVPAVMPPVLVPLQAVKP